MDSDEEQDGGRTSGGLFGDDDEEHDAGESLYDPSSSLLLHSGTTAVANEKIEDDSSSNVYSTDQNYGDRSIDRSNCRATTPAHPKTQPISLSAGSISHHDGSGISAPVENSQSMLAITEETPSPYPRHPMSSAVISKEIPHQFYPEQGYKYVSVKFPPTVRFQAEPFDEHTERLKQKTNSSYNKSLLPGILNYDFSPPQNTMRWRFKRDNEGNPIQDESGNLIRESNTRLIEWEDGSFTLYIGKNSFDCQIRKDQTHIFEDSHEELKPLHGVTNERFLFVISNYLVGSDKSRFMSKFKSNIKDRQKTILTSLDETTSSQQDMLQTLENQREGLRLQRRQKESEKEKGITRAFLENDNSPADDDNADSLSRIKEARFGVSKKRF